MSFIGYTSAFPISIRSLRIVVVLSVRVLDADDRQHFVQSVFQATQSPGFKRFISWRVNFLGSSVMLPR
jgi:hypothetical protein